MKTRTIAWIAAIPFVAVLARRSPPRPARNGGSGGAPPGTAGTGHPVRQEARGNLQERYLYVSTIAQSTTDPDFIAVIGADPRRRDFGKIVNRVDMPNVGDELHHYGYSHDQKRLLVPGLFSNRIHVFEIKGDGKRLDLKTVNDKLAAKSGYVVPHGVMAMPHGRAMVTMIGAATGTTQPGGIVEIDDKTGAFVDHFGPGADRGPNQLDPKYMYDFESLDEANRGISTTFGPPALCGGGIDPSCLGGEVAVWDVRRQKVIQTADLGRAQRGADGALRQEQGRPAGVHQHAGHQRDLAGGRRRPRRRLRLPAGARPG